MSPSVVESGVDDFVQTDIHFEVPTTDLIPGIAAVRASCHVDASGEPIVLVANNTARSALAASTGPCTIVLVLVGVDVALPALNTTPLGRSSFYLPGISTVTLGIVDASVDLVTSLNSTSRVANGIADMSPNEIAWSSWGAERISLHAPDGIGSVAEAELSTTFTYTMSLALTVYALSIELYHQDLSKIGSFVGTPSLVTALSVDLRPHALFLQPPTNVEHDRATFSWSGTVDADVDHLELRLTDGTASVSYRLLPTAGHLEVLLRPSTHYEARIVSVDGAGQAAPSNAVSFDSPAAPPPSATTPIEAQGNPVVTWTLVGLAALAGIVAYALGSLRRGKRE